MNHDIETIFATARELQVVDQINYLDEVCGEDAELRQRIDSLLAADLKAGGFLKSVAHIPDQASKNAGAWRSSDLPEEKPGEIIGRYKLLQIIGEGGFGTVWMAEQKEPVKRKVALKIVKLGMDTKQIVSRFEVERQALAMMDHPNIAKVFDAGSTDTGRPYFVMELVKGVPIHEYADSVQLDTSSRLRLFALVCNAIQHAHQKGVIHRDIKPSNILVTMHDGIPVPKVIDFGIAKATSQELTQKTLFTEYHHLIGTPVYMSPEQAEMSGLDIDTRSDVYSLGVLLYELLTGTPPFAHHELMERGYGEMMRIIQEDTPHKPSTRLSTLGSLSAATAERRHTDINKLGLVLRGDLDWIVMKCLEKDRTRRYETATGLAEDIARHLNDEPVQAGPPRFGYKLRKFVKRNRGRVVAACMIAVVLVVGIIGTSSGMVWALHERDAAKIAQTESTKRAEELQLVSDFQSEQLGDIDPQRMGIALRRTIFSSIESETREQLEKDFAGVNFTSIAMTTLEESFFRRTIAAIDKQFAGQPVLQAQLLQSLCETMQELGLVFETEDPQKRVLDIRRSTLGNEHPDTLDSMNSMGSLLQAQGKLSEADSYYTEVIELSRRVLGDDHPGTLISLSNMGSLREKQGRLSEAEAYIQEALEGRRRVLGDEHPSTLLSVNFMGLLRSGQGNYAEAEAYFREALEGRRRVLGNDHPQTLNAIRNVASAQRKLGKLSEAEPYYREAIDGYRRMYGNDHPETLLSLNGMGVLLYNQRKYTEAEPFYRESLEGSSRVLGEFHPITLSCMHNLASLLRAQGMLSDAELYYHQVLEGRRRLHGDEHPSTLNTMNSLGSLIKEQGRFSEAEAYYKTALEVRRRILGDDHPSTLNSINNLGSLLQDQGKLEEAEQYYLESHEGRRRLYGESHIKTLISSNNYGSLLNSLGRFHDASVTLSKGEPAARNLWGEKADLLGSYLSKLGQAQVGVGLYSEAESTLLEAYSLLVESSGTAHENAQACIATLESLYTAWNIDLPGNGYDIKAANFHGMKSDSD